MLFGFVLVLAGAALAVMGVRIALERRRPASLGGALLAPAGVALAYVGLARLIAAGAFG